MILYYNVNADTFNTIINLQYYYNKSLYFSINSGLVESGTKYHCTLLQLLDCKEFSTGYWQWCHLFLLDAVRQFGYPSLFITISPSEWSFPQVGFHLTVMLLGIFHHYEKSIASCYSYFRNHRLIYFFHFRINFFCYNNMYYFYNDATGDCHLFFRYKSLL